MIGGFFESHTEDVTSVKFHPTNADLMATGSTDGLINIFDISKESEDDSLNFCLNTEDSVGSLKWHPNDVLTCITNTNCLQIWDFNTQDLLKNWSRDAITETMQRKSVIDCNLIDCHDSGDKMLALATSNYNKGRIFL
jgi:WD40 repeat protein